VAKALQIPIDAKLKEVTDLPYTISFTIRKRMQIDNLNELPKDKRPPDSIIWDGTSEEIDEWLDRVFSNEKNEVDLVIDEIE